MSPQHLPLIVKQLLVDRFWANMGFALRGKFYCFSPRFLSGVSILQYADDTIVFMEHNTEKAVYFLRNCQV